jgi:hypothetical protein
MSHYALTYRPRVERRPLTNLAFERHEEAFDSARTEAALYVGRRDRLQLPALRPVLVQNLLKFVAGHLSPDHLLPKLQHLVLVSICHLPILSRQGARGLPVDQAPRENRRSARRRSLVDLGLRRADQDVCTGCGEASPTVDLVSQAVPLRQSRPGGSTETALCASSSTHCRPRTPYQSWFVICDGDGQVARSTRVCSART